MFQGNVRLTCDGATLTGTIFDSCDSLQCQATFTGVDGMCNLIDGAAAGCAPAEQPPWTLCDGAGAPAAAGGATARHPAAIGAAALARAARRLASQLAWTAAPR